jgi:outer membrane protein
MKRRMKQIRLCLSLCLLCWSLQAKAQTKQWTLEECIRHAIENNIDLKLRTQEQATREIELNTSRHSWLPDLNAGIGQNFDFGRSPSKDDVIVDRNSASSSASLQLSMPVFDGMRIPNDIAARRLNLLAATEALNKAKEDLAVGVASYFLQALYNKEILTIAELQVALISEQAKKTEALVAAGKVPASQLYDIRAQQAKDEVTLTEARNNVSLALLDLAQSLELERLGIHFDIAVPDIKDVVEEYTGSIVPPDHVYQNAVAIKPQIREQEYLLESQRKMLKVAQSGYYPKLNLNASYSNGYYHYSDSGTDNAVNPGFGDQWRQNERKTVGLSLSIPIFNRFEVRNSVRSARVAIINRELMMENSKKTLYKEIQQAYHNATAAQEKYVSSGKSVEASKLAFTYAEERYGAGKSTVFEYNESKTKYAQSLSEQAQAKYEFIFRTKILDFYNGKPIMF